MVIRRWHRVCAYALGLWAAGAFAAAPQAPSPATCDNVSVKQARCVCEIRALRPTQFAVGMQSVRDKQKELSGRKSSKLDSYLAKHPAPAVKGPEGALYIIDHHHLARALLELGEERMMCEIRADLSDHPVAQFWEAMEQRKWVYLLDAAGRAQVPAALPRRIDQLQDDPFRTLAGYVRDTCGYKKTSTPFAEFAWADYFRKSVPIKPGMDIDNHTVQRARAAAQGPAAANLPGYCGRQCACGQGISG